MEKEIKVFEAARAQYERDNEILKKEISNFAYEIKHGLGEEIKNNSSYTEKKGGFIMFLKKLFFP